MIDWAAFFLQLTVVGTGAVSAYAWARSAAVKMPCVTESSFDGGGPYPAALAEQARWNQRAAFTAAVAAFGQTLALLLTTFMPAK